MTSNATYLWWTQTLAGIFSLLYFTIVEAQLVNYWETNGGVLPVFDPHHPNE